MKAAFPIAFLICVVLAACAPAASLQPADAGPTIKGDGRCDAAAVAWAVGQKGDETVMNKVWKESGAGLLRPIAPDRAVTKDFREDRINVYLDANNTILRLSCG
ncbi:MAG: I78 family peptidase inhibitor [Pseudoxanthomonas sp.]